MIYNGTSELWKMVFMISLNWWCFLNRHYCSLLIRYSEMNVIPWILNRVNGKFTAAKRFFNILFGTQNVLSGVTWKRSIRLMSSIEIDWWYYFVNKILIFLSTAQSEKSIGVQYLLKNKSFPSKWLPHQYHPFQFSFSISIETIGNIFHIRFYWIKKCCWHAELLSNKFCFV